MENLLQLTIDDTCDPAIILHRLGDGIKVLASINAHTTFETQTINWLVALLASGITDVADRLRQ